MSNTDMGKKRTALILIGVMIGILLASFDVSIVTTAMPQIIGSLNGFDYYTWPLISYLLCMTVVMPLFGKLADIYGFKRIYVFGIITFLIGSALCGMSQSMLQLVIFRGIQGIGGAILISNTLAIVGILFAPAERAKYIGIVSSMGALASIAGPFLGGYITDHLSWRWVFYVNVPIGLLALVVIILALPEHTVAKERKKIDYFGAAALVIALIPMLLAFTWGGNEYDWSSLPIIGMLVFSVIMLVVFAIIETKADDPIIPMALFRNSVFNFSALEMFLLNAVMIGAIIFLPLFVQSVIGSTASKSGAIVTPLMVSVIVGAVISGFIVSKTKKYKALAIIGCVITCIGSALLAFMGVETSSSQVIINMMVLGLGTGITVPIFTVATQNAFPENQLGVVTSSIQFFKSMGSTIASSVLGSIMGFTLNKGVQDLDIGKFSGNISGILTDPNTLTNIEVLNELKVQIPVEILPDFEKLMGQVKQIFANSLQDAFIICTVIAGAALLAIFFMKEIPLKKGSDKASSIE